MFSKKALSQFITDITHAYKQPGNKLVFARRGLTVSVEEDKYICVKEPAVDGVEHTMKFPNVWLRDNCSCSTCFHQTSQSRIINWQKFDTNVRAVEIKANTVKQQFHILWSDKHESTYDLSWLKERDFSAECRHKYLEAFYKPKTIHWSGNNIQKIIQYFDFNTVMQNDKALQDWLKALSVFGVAVMRDAPLEENVVKRLADRVGFIRKTTYGEEFKVQNKPGAKNYAYLSTPLPLHTDLPYYEYKPGVNILHCIEQSKSRGGDSLLVDGFHIADCLKENHLRDYKILTGTLVDWNDIGAEGELKFHHIWRAPVICLDSDSNYTRINFSIPQRDSHFSVALEKVIPWYEAYAKFLHLANNDVYAFKMETGDVLTFNNIRLMHGRTGYDDTADNIRFIVGAYMDWDIIDSRLRVLKTTLRQHK